MGLKSVLAAERLMPDGQHGVLLTAPPGSWTGAVQEFLTFSPCPRVKANNGQSTSKGEMVTLFKNFVSINVQVTGRIQFLKVWHSGWPGMIAH